MTVTMVTTVTTVTTRKIKTTALVLFAVALAFYFGIILLTANSA